MKTLLFIFNPQSGKARVRQQLYEIVAYYTLQGYLVTVYPTGKSGDAYTCICDFYDRYDRIVCSGGDGTLNEVVSGLVDSGRECELGYVPSGSTNDFGRSVGIPMEMEEALQISCIGNPVEIDVGRLNDRHFVYVAGFGSFTKVSYETPQKMKNAIGHLAYFLQGIRAISELCAHHMTVSWDDKVVEDEFIVGLFMNSFSIAGFRNPVSSLTDLNDGIFEVILIRMPKNILELQEIIAALLGNTRECDRVLCFQASRIEIESEEMEWTVDGEFGGAYERVIIENQNRAVKILTGQKE